MSNVIEIPVEKDKIYAEIEQYGAIQASAVRGCLQR